MGLLQIFDFRPEARHDAFGQPGAGENNVGSFRLQSWNHFPFGDRFRLEEPHLPLDFRELEASAVNSAMRIARQLLLNRRKRRESSRDAH